jgi:hypothetical protein
MSKDSIAIASNAMARKSAVRRKRESAFENFLDRPALRRARDRVRRWKIVLEIEIRVPFMTCQLPV